MRTITNENGFTLTELLISTSIMMLTLGGAMTTFKTAIGINQSTTELADSNQNLRAGTNLLVRDLMQAARGIPIGGIAIPSGAGSQPINRPSPPGGQVYRFDNTVSTTLPAIIPGAGLGPTIDGQATDIVTIMMTDSLLTPLTVNAGGGKAALAANGASITLGTDAAWISGNPAQGIPPVVAGDLMWFSMNGNTLQTVTSTDATHIYFAPSDWFNFNQPNAAQGSITQVANPLTQGTVTRIVMLTYYVDSTTTPGTPRLTRVQNAGTPQALAGVMEDLQLSYDLVDGGTNPTDVKSVPYVAVINGVNVPFSPNQIRKVNLHVGVRSDTMSVQQHDYIRNHLTTVVSIRSLAFVPRYQ